MVDDLEAKVRAILPPDQADAFMSGYKERPKPKSLPWRWRVIATFRKWVAR